MAESHDPDIPVLREVVLAGDVDEVPPGERGIEDLAPLVERIAARIDRELEGTFEATVQQAVDEALRTSLAAYQERIRVLLLRELMEQLQQPVAPRRTDADD